MTYISNLVNKAEALGKGEVIKQPLKPIGSWGASNHALDQKDLQAIIAAIASERPLLLTGEPGVGKSHLARAASNLTKRFFVPIVVKPDDEIGDLLYEIDHTNRLADAQLAGALKKTFDSSLNKYVRPGPIWHAFTEPDDCLDTSAYSPPEQPFNRDNGVLLLIDEIDKASLALMSGLLEVLGNMSFEAPGHEKAIQNRGNPPLVILTSNGDRALPAPLLRRCIIHNMVLPSEWPLFLERMVYIGESHMGKVVSPKVVKACARAIFDSRDMAMAYQPGSSEFVDLLRTLHEVAPDNEKKQLKQLKVLSTYFLKKDIN